MASHALFVVLMLCMCVQDHPPTTAAYLTLIARVLVHQPNFFFTFLEKMCSQSQQTVRGHGVELVVGVGLIGMGRASVVV